MSVRILLGDMRQRLADLPDASVDSCVCDPPYHLTSIVKRFGSEKAKPAMSAAERRFAKTGGADRKPGTDQYGRLSKGFMGQTWDGGDVAFQPETWAEVLRVLKPGGHLIAFSGTRTYHRMAVAIEDAGFEIRDQLAWVYGSGFPKSKNLGDGWGTALKPAWEPICLARKPLIGTNAANMAEHGVGGLNIDGCRIFGEDEAAAREGEESQERRYTDEGSTDFAAKPGRRYKIKRWKPGATLNAEGGTWKQGVDGPDYEGELQPGRWPANLCHDGSDEVLSGFPADAGAGGKASGPTLTGPSDRNCMAGSFGGVADTPFYGDSGNAGRFFATFPIGEEEWEFAKNVHAAKSAESLCGSCGTPIAGAPAATLTLDFSLAESQAGRASIGICSGCIPNLALVPTAADPESTGTIRTIPIYSESNGFAVRAIASIIKAGAEERAAVDSAPASATRFLYCPKATTDERGEGNNHPTVKPVALMRWLARLVTPKGGTVLDPFMGSGSTALACDAEQFNFIGCELSPEYAAIAEKRIRAAAGMFADISIEHTGPATRSAA